MIKVLDYYIDADAHCYIVKKEAGIDKKGDTVYTTLWYPSTMSTALELIAHAEHRKIVCENDLSLSEAITRFEQINAQIKEIGGLVNG